jgi:hypothetical protein
MKTKFKRGQTVELTVNANAIPAGRYKFMCQRDEILLFSIGKQVLFGLAAAHWSEYLIPLPGLGGRRTSRDEFLAGYQRLTEELSANPTPFNPSALTFCMLGESCGIPASSDIGSTSSEYGPTFN